MVGVASRCEWWGVAIRGLGRRRGGKLSIPGPLRFRSCLRNHPAPTRQDLPPLSCAGCLGPSFPAPFFPRPLPHPHLPGGGGAGEAPRGRGNGRVRVGEGSSRGALTALSHSHPILMTYIGGNPEGRGREGQRS